MKLREIINLLTEEFKSKQEVIDHFVKTGRSAAAGAAAWDRGWRGGSSKKKKPFSKTFKKDYHDELDDRRFKDIDESSKIPNFSQIVNEVMPLILKELGLESLPNIQFVKQVKDKKQPTFGKYINDSDTIQVSIDNRHPVDIIRTLAHEMVHHKQDTLKRLGPHSGDTGSSIENQAHEIAGIIMRHINKKYPNFLKLDNIEI